MKKDLHPVYKKCVVKCACGNTFETRATVESMSLDICSQCHPFYTGKQKLVDTAGRVEQYLRKFEKTQAIQDAGSKGKKKGAAASEAKKAAQPAAE